LTGSVETGKIIAENAAKRIESHVNTEAPWRSYSQTQSRKRNQPLSKYEVKISKRWKLKRWFGEIFLYWIDSVENEGVYFE
jgi:hypothetical protein